MYTHVQNHIQNFCKKFFSFSIFMIIGDLSTAFTANSTNCPDHSLH